MFQLPVIKNMRIFEREQSETTLVEAKACPPELSPNKCGSHSFVFNKKVKWWHSLLVTELPYAGYCLAWSHVGFSMRPIFFTAVKMDNIKLAHFGFN